MASGKQQKQCRSFSRGYRIEYRDTRRVAEPPNHSAHLDDQTSAAVLGSLSSLISLHSTSSACAARRAEDPAICPRFSTSLARVNRHRHSGGLSRNPLPFPHPHPSLSNPHGTAGMPDVKGRRKPNMTNKRKEEFLMAIRGHVTPTAGARTAIRCIPTM